MVNYTHWLSYMADNWDFGIIGIYTSYEKALEDMQENVAETASYYDDNGFEELYRLVKWWDFDIETVSFSKQQIGRQLQTENGNTFLKIEEL
jgi:hypothetical protein